jgi:very-long-chain enoyl-CoA reductase
MQLRLHHSNKEPGKPIRRLPKDATVTPSDTTANLYKQIASAANFDINRLRITNATDGKYIENSRDVTIANAGLSESSTIAIKDLGPQIAWRTVFIVEYLGPILIHPLIYYLRPYIYPTPSLTATKTPAPSSLQMLSMALVILHFIKREFETVLVHRFSSSTMPLSNIFKNSAHYWLLSGLNIAYWTYSPSSASQKIGATKTGAFALPTDTLTTIGLALFTIGELANLSTHLTLRNLRSEGSTARGIPKGFGFGIVTCPNYMFEVIAWVGITLVTRSLSTALFVIVAGGQMALWAKKKERRYRNEFGDKYKKKRFAMIPWII